MTIGTMNQIALSFSAMLALEQPAVLSLSLKMLNNNNIQLTPEKLLRIGYECV